MRMVYVLAAIAEMATCVLAGGKFYQHPAATMLRAAILGGLGMFFVLAIGITDAVQRRQ